MILCTNVSTLFAITSSGHNPSATWKSCILFFTYLPELLTRVFAAYPLQDLCATRMSSIMSAIADMVGLSCFNSLVYESAHLVYLVVDDDV